MDGEVDGLIRPKLEEAIEAKYAGITDAIHAAAATDLEVLLPPLEQAYEKDREILLGDVKSRAQRQGLINLRRDPEAIQTARRQNFHHLRRRAEDTPPPTTDAEKAAVAKAEAKRRRKLEHRRGVVTVIEASQ